MGFVSWRTDHTRPTVRDTRQPMLKRMGRFATGATAIIALLTGCAGGTPDISGMWVPDDGSGIKTINSDGTCSGMFYNNGQPLDIGGGMACTLSETETDGFYTLVVRQPPNEATYRVSFDGDDAMTMHTSVDQPIVTLTRQ